jgi:hypothetical protein
VPSSASGDALFWGCDDLANLELHLRSAVALASADFTA